MNDLVIKKEVKTMILWVPTDQFHPIKNGVDLASRIKNNKFVKLDTGIFSKDQKKKDKGSQYSLAIPFIKNYIRDFNLSEYKILKSIDDQAEQNNADINLIDEDDIDYKDSYDQELLSDCSVDTFSYNKNNFYNNLVFEEQIEENVEEEKLKILETKIAVVDKFKKLIINGKVNE